MAGILYTVSTPIGNPDDISLRAIKILQSVDIIAAENIATNKPRIEKITGSLNAIWLPYFDGNESTQSVKIIYHLLQGKNVALISSAGTPVICDPGYKLIEQAYKYNIPVESIPGCCSVIAALTLSGARPFPFTFLGFIKANDKLLKTINDNNYTKIFFESSHRITKTIEFLWNNIQENWEIIAIKDITKSFYERIVINKNNYNNFNHQGEWIVILNSKN
jgi:16S rRNA (cytidine1402-2'-O)-methyltransferase